MVIEHYLYLYVISPELKQSGESSLHLAEELVEEAELSHSILIQQGPQTWYQNITLLLHVQN